MTSAQENKERINGEIDAEFILLRIWLMAIHISPFA